ncbi:MAG TPA: ATP-dependent zinc metalloprotease FtsH [Candidatus Pacearchaeota archaeon]|nr:ATP-dependent zinc metalloprotease FtsH [Candidatus Pacearchaeota archaeon]HQI74271.1 ATP-dependent zinc metalloprotease FtsH [Candidatus Pacearchaeota archaeon]
MPNIKINSFAKKAITAFLVLLFVSTIFSFFYSSEKKTEKIPFSTLAQDVLQEKVKSIDAQGQELFITYNDNSKKISRKETESSLSESFKNYGIDPTRIAKVKINLDQEKEDTWSWLGALLLFTILPLLVIGFFLFSMLKQNRAGAGQIFDFSRSKAKLFNATSKKTDFSDIGGLKEAKEELEEVVDFLKNPSKFTEIGARVPRGVLLVGPTGTGKTLIAKAVASQANVPFFSISGSEFIELFVGVGAARVRDLFATAKKHQPSIIFIDELDAIGGKRTPGFGGGHEEREQTLNQILVEMDGFDKDNTCIILAATNRPDILDSALLRPGRFDRRVVFDLPDVKSREEILKIHCKDKKTVVDLRLDEVAERTPGFSGADLSNLINEAALLAVKRGQKIIRQIDILDSIEKVLLGPERKSHLLSEKEKEISAYHEVGHALVNTFSPGGDTVRKVSIISRGYAGGYTLTLPREEKKFKTRDEFISDIATLMGGYCAEKLVFGEVTTGASNDLQRASSIARSLVKEYGMSKLGPVTFGEKQMMEFTNDNFGEAKNYSDKIAERIDEEVENFIKEGQDKANKILKDKKNLLSKVAKVLIEKETIEKEEFENLINN